MAETVSPCSELRLDHTKNRHQRWMVPSAPAMGNRMALSRLGSATWSVLDFVRTDLRTVRLAIATWDKGASWRDQGWAGENVDRRDKALRFIHCLSRKAPIHLQHQLRSQAVTRRCGFTHR